MSICLPLLRKSGSNSANKENELWVSGQKGISGQKSLPERDIIQGSFAPVYSQHFTLGVSSADSICIPLHLRLRDDNAKAKWRLARRRREGIKKGGWVIWLDEDTERLSSTTVAQWTRSSRNTWLEECKARYNKRCEHKQDAGYTSSSPPTKGVHAEERRILYLFVLLHGMSPPALLRTDVVENFGNLIATVLERFPIRSPPSPPQAFHRSPTKANNDAVSSSLSASHASAEPSGASAAAAPSTDNPAPHTTAQSRSATADMDDCAPASVLFIIYSYRGATWQSVAACMSRIVPRLAAELSVLLENWDEVQLFAVGHSLGGLLWRFVLLRRLQQLLYQDKGQGSRKHSKSTPPECYGNLLNCLQHPNLHLRTFCTLASPHVGAYKSSAVYRSMPRAVAGLRFLPNSDYAQELLLHNDKGFLAALAAEEHAGRSHLTYPFPQAPQDGGSCDISRLASFALRSWQSRSFSLEKADAKHSERRRQTIKEESGALKQQMSGVKEALEAGASLEQEHPHVGLADTPETHDVPGEVAVLALNRFEAVLLYGILETDWIVSANSALATATDLRRTPEGRLAMENPMYPIHVKSATARSSGTPTHPAPSETGVSRPSVSWYNNKNIELLLVQQHIDVFTHISSIDRYLVYINQNPLFLAPHATLKGSPCIVTEAEQRKMRKEAAPILEHVAAHLLQIPQQYGKRTSHRSSSNASKNVQDVPTIATPSQPALVATETELASIGTDFATVPTSQPAFVTGNA